MYTHIYILIIAISKCYNYNGWQAIQGNHKVIYFWSH